MVIVSRSTDHPSCPRNDQYVRVELYQSKLVIRPHTSFDDVITIFIDRLLLFVFMKKQCMIYVLNETVIKRYSLLSY